MESLPLIAYLFPLSFTLLISLATLPLLIKGCIYRSIRYQIIIQLAIVGLKLAIDTAAVIFAAVASSGRHHLDDRKKWLIQYILFWGSATCVQTYEASPTTANNIISIMTDTL